MRPTILFSPAEAALPADFSRFDRLAIDDGRTRRPRSARRSSYLLAQHRVDLLQRALAHPLVAVIAYRALMGKLPRQHLPLAPRPQHVQQGVQDCTQIDPRRRSSSWFAPQHRFDQRPLFIRHVARVAFPFRPLVHAFSLRFLAGSYRSFRDYSHFPSVSDGQFLRTLLQFLAEYRLVRIPSFYYKDGRLIRRMELYQGVVPSLDEQPLSEGIDLTQAEHEHLVLLNAEEEVLDLYPLYQLLATEETRYETHMAFFKQRKKDDGILKGESVQGAFPVNLHGFNDFEVLQGRILDTLS